MWEDKNNKESFFLKAENYMKKRSKRNKTYLKTVNKAEYQTPLKCSKAYMAEAEAEVNQNMNWASYHITSQNLCIRVSIWEEAKTESATTVANDNKKP